MGINPIIFRTVSVSITNRGLMKKLFLTFLALSSISFAEPVASGPMVNLTVKEWDNLPGMYYPVFRFLDKKGIAEIGCKRKFFYNKRDISVDLAPALLIQYASAAQNIAEFHSERNHGRIVNLAKKFPSMGACNLSLSQIKKTGARIIIQQFHDNFTNDDTVSINIQ